MFSMQKVQRYDRGRLSRAGSTPTGGARMRAQISRTGLQKYKLADGSTRVEYRSPAEVFKAESLASFVGAALTIQHPVNGVTPSTWAKDAVGVITAAPERVRGADGYEYAATQVDVTRADALTKVDAGELEELSAGYECFFDGIPGVVPAGEPDAGARFDGSQLGITINHVALLERGRARAGREAKLLTDADDAMRLDADGNQLIQERDDTAPSQEPMKIKFAGREWDAGPELQVAITTFENEAGALKTKADAATVAAATADAKADKADKDRQDAEAKASPAALDKLVNDEIAFRAKVAPVLDTKDAKFDFTGKSRKDVQSAVLAKLGKKLKTDAEDIYVSAYFDAAIEEHTARAGRSEDYTRRDADPLVDPTKPVMKNDAGVNVLDDAAWTAHLASLKK